MHTTQTSTTECANRIITTIPLITRELWNLLQAKSVISMTSVQFGLLWLLDQHRLTLTDLSQLWGVSPASMSKTINLLVERTWVAREVDPADRRRKFLSLTATGRRIHEDVHKAVRQSLAQSLEDVNEEQLVQIVSALDLLVETLT